jgi:hypothetical protein
MTASGILRAAHVARIKDAYGLYRARGQRSHPRGTEAGALLLLGSTGP